MDSVEGHILSNGSTLDGNWLITSTTTWPQVMTSSEELEQEIVRLPTYLRASATTICVILVLIGCPGNLLVPFVVLKTKDLRNSTNIFLINLSVSDLLILLISSPTVLIELHSQPETWYLGLFMCKAVSFVEILVAHGSILTILAISFERYYAICRPLEAGYKCTKRRATIIIVIIWIIATVSTLPMLSITELDEAEYIDGSVVPVCSNTLQEGWHPVYFFVIIVTFFVIPLIILVVLYIFISRKLTADSERLNSSGNFKKRNQVRRQVVVMLASVCIAFFVCLLPFRLMTLWIILSSREDIVALGAETYYILLFISRLLLYVNSSINPILYNVISSKFRDAFCRILRVNMTPTTTTIANSSYRSNDHSMLSERHSTTPALGSLNNGHIVSGNNSNNNTLRVNSCQRSPNRSSKSPTRSPNHFSFNGHNGQSCHNGHITLNVFKSNELNKLSPTLNILAKEPISPQVVVHSL